MHVQMHKSWPLIETTMQEVHRHRWWAQLKIPEQRLYTDLQLVLLKYLKIYMALGASFT